ncbi:MAG: hypothetical protein JNK87_33980 [Bryobacterales bacterium]|nr:hypothetical protein [Bryobacterales bacterium]
MPTQKTIKAAKRAKKQGKSASTQAGEFVREEMEKLKSGDGPESPQQAIAIGLSRARRAGVELPPPKKGKGTEAVRKRAKRDLAAGRKQARKRS